VRAYLELAAAHPDVLESLEGQLRAAAILADKERWKEAAAVLDAVIARTDLSREIRIEAYARKGYVQLEQGALDDAEATLGEAIATWRKASHVDDPYYIAMAHFYLGEIDARRFDKQPVRSADEELSADMREKRVHLMNAYGHWKEALLFKQAYWATAAGYQMSQIFYEYWQAAVMAPFPDGMSVEARPQYTAEVRARVRENLVKALDGHRANVELADAYGVTTSWSEASKTRAAEILGVLDRDSRTASR
jgi:tetratricopeptide (TPR) repeat protein